MRACKIIQIEEYEYNKLCEAAKANKIKIKEMAEDMYKKKGVYGIKLTLYLDKDVEDQISLRPYTSYRDWESFPLSMNDSRKLSKFLNSAALEFMEKRFGRQIKNFNFYVKERRDLQLTKLKFIGFTIAGWLGLLTATILSLVVLIN